MLKINYTGGMVFLLRIATITLSLFAALLIALNLSCFVFAFVLADFKPNRGYR